jgi:hypothetical protein
MKAHLEVGIQWETRDIPQAQDLAFSFMHQLFSNRLFNHYRLACYQYHLAYYHHVALSQASLTLTWMRRQRICSSDSGSGNAHWHWMKPFLCATL